MQFVVAKERRRLGGSPGFSTLSVGVDAPEDVS
jgi:hypothetical protein